MKRLHMSTHVSIFVFISNEIVRVSFILHGALSFYRRNEGLNKKWVCIESGPVLSDNGNFVPLLSIIGHRIVYECCVFSTKLRQKYETRVFGSRKMPLCTFVNSSRRRRTDSPFSGKLTNENGGFMHFMTLHAVGMMRGALPGR